MAGEWIKKFEPWFVDAARTCARTNSNTDADTLKDYFCTKLRYIDFGHYDELRQKLASEKQADLP